MTALIHGRVVEHLTRLRLRYVAERLDAVLSDAARAEHMAREAEAAAEQIATIAPQAVEFQNSPLEIFGEHEAATIAQMRNCMGVGNVVAGTFTGSPGTLTIQLPILSASAQVSLIGARVKIVGATATGFTSAVVGGGVTQQQVSTNVYPAVVIAGPPRVRRRLGR